MLIKRDRVDGLRVASPCSMRWDEMRGDERVRFCDSCNLHVYNISAMTRREAERLIVTTEGRFCSRLHRRADGTVITKDCPVGLRALRRRVSKVAGAAAAAILSLCVSAFGKVSPRGLRPGGAGASLTRANFDPRGQYSRGEISGRVLDMNGVPLDGAEVVLINQDTGKKEKVQTDAKGRFRFSMLSRGRYMIEATAAGFAPFTTTDVKLGDRETIDRDINLEILGALTGIVFVDEPKGSYTGPGISTVFSGDKVRKLPF